MLHVQLPLRPVFPNVYGPIEFKEQQRIYQRIDKILWSQPALIPEAQTFLKTTQLKSEEGQQLLSAMFEVSTFTHSGVLDCLREHEAG